MGNKSLARLLALLTAMALTAAACAGSDTAEDETDVTTELEETETEDTDEQATGGTVEGGTVEAAPSCTGESDGILQIGGLFPQTGNLAFLGPPEEAAVALAIQEINEAGGVLGKDAVFMPGDSSDDDDVASQTVDRHLASGVDAILGTASSGVSFTVIDKITRACKIYFSRANTSPGFTDYADDDLHFRSAPSDVLQGRVLADLIIEEGSTTVGLMALQGPYGEGLLEFTKAPLEEQGAEVVVDFFYDPEAQSFDAEVQQMVSAGPEAIVVIGFDETASILTSLFKADFTPDVKKIYLVDGNVGNALGQKFSEAGVLSGIKGTLPAAALTDDFRQRLLTVDPELIDFTYGPEAYDAVVVIALATELAGTDDAGVIATKMHSVTSDGKKCTSFAECKELLAAGTDIDYHGPAGPLAFGPDGKPTEATFAILSYAEGANTIDTEATMYRSAKL